MSGCRRNEMHPFLPNVAVSSPILGILGIVGTLLRVPKSAEYVPSMRPGDGMSPCFAFLRIFATGRCKFTVGRAWLWASRGTRPAGFRSDSGRREDAPYSFAAGIAKLTLDQTTSEFQGTPEQANAPYEKVVLTMLL